MLIFSEILQILQNCYKRHSTIKIYSCQLFYFFLFFLFSSQKKISMAADHHTDFNIALFY